MPAIDACALVSPPHIRSPAPNQHPLPRDQCTEAAFVALVPQLATRRCCADLRHCGRPCVRRDHCNVYFYRTLCRRLVPGDHILGRASSQLASSSAAHSANCVVRRSQTPRRCKCRFFFKSIRRRRPSTSPCAIAMSVRDSRLVTALTPPLSVRHRERGNRIGCGCRAAQGRGGPQRTGGPYAAAGHTGAGHEQ